MSIRKEIIKVYEMTCNSCEARVEKAIRNLTGVLSAKASFSDEFAEVEYDDELCSREKIKEAVKNSGYSTEASKDYKFIGILLIVAAVFLLGLNTGGFDMEAKLTNASYAVLFVIGVLTSIHCVGMCGGIMLSQSLSKESSNKFEALEPALLYNIGRVIAYTILGGIIGAVGSVLSLSVGVKAALQIFAGIFMVIMGSNMAGFKLFRKFNIKLPHAACNIKNKSGSPFIVGLLNGLMPCGPLQTMQLFALGTGSAVKGALSMFMFSIGTVPLMLTFGALSGLLTKGYTKKILKLSGILVIILGLIMGNRGLNLYGININPMASIARGTVLSSNANPQAAPSNAKATIQDGVQVINMSADTSGYSPNVLYVQKGMPIKWIVNGNRLTSCNNAIVVQNKQYKLKSGENVIELPASDKDIKFSCWMGMIGGVIRVVDKLDTVDTSKDAAALPASGSGGSCCSGGVSSQPSIYGDDLSKVPTETLVNKALTAGKFQSAVFKGKGYELQPLIVVTGNASSTKFTFDLTDFDNAEGKYDIVDADTGTEISSFTGKKGVNSEEFTPRKVGGYAIVKDNSVLGIIEVTSDLKTADLEKIRSKYLGQ